MIFSACYLYSGAFKIYSTLKIGPVVLILTCLSLAVWGQQENHFLIEGQLHYGFIMAHSHRVNHLVTGHTYGFQVNAGMQGYGNKLQKAYNTPQTGFSLAYFDFANPDVLGNGICLLAYADLPVVRKNNFLFSIHLADGFGFTTKRFDAIENHKNTLTGTKLNAAIQIFFQTKYVLSKRLDFRLAMGLTHFSNGSYATPNLGINNVSLSSGIIFYLDSAHSVPPKETLQQPDKKVRLEVLAGGAPKEIYPTGGKKYFSWTVSTAVFKILSHKFRFGIGTDFIYDLSLTERFARDRVYTPVIPNRMRSGVYIANELMLSHLTAMLDIGYYLYSPFKGDGSSYHRIGLKYFCTDHWFINYSLRTHYGKADNVEAGLGYRF